METKLDCSVAYEKMMELHRKTSTGERKRKLESEHGHAEKKFLTDIWWPAFGHFDGLYPEYEVRDFKDGIRFLDFAFVTVGMKICIEIDGYGSHWRDPGRWQFADHLFRQNHLVIDGWLVLRFAYDDLLEKPRRCQQILQQLLGKWGGSSINTLPACGPVEQTILRLAMRSRDALSIKSVADELHIHPRTAAKYLQRMVAKDLLCPLYPKRTRNHYYLLHSTLSQHTSLSL